MRRQGQPRMDYDSPWKEFLTIFFREFISLVLPELHAAIDWTRPPQFLDNELRRLTPHSETGRLYTDRLVKVWLRTGEIRAILIHIEAQSQFTAEIEVRVFTYYARIWLELRLPIVSVVIYADKNPHWRPNRYVQELPGTRLEFEFHTVKLLDLDESTLVEEAKQRNPAALMLLAFRKAIETEQEVQMRFDARKQLVTLMMEYGYHEDDQAHILRLMEWVLMLPEVLEQQVEELIEEYKRKRRTTFVSRLERRAIERGFAEGLAEGRTKGRAEGLAEGRAEGLAEGRAEGLAEGRAEGRAALQRALMRTLIRRFGDTAESARSTVEACSSIESLEMMLDLALDAPTVDAFVEQAQRLPRETDAQE
ncbi:MAG: Rpn family recombination-promoting nuclease/putative transposase [Fimbriimonadales bacterium]|nr:Rpn family recombination-promoting nuclease/putative transposase [Fimbriimonadales bacterium]